jgi:hypothetical protein
MFGIIDEIVRPIGHRVGTALGAYLTAQGIASDDIGIILSAVPVVLGVVVDLVVRRVL